MCLSKFEIKTLATDLLIIGGGTAGCYAAISLGSLSSSSDAKTRPLEVLLVEKANIERSGCLASGVNALNAYISEDHIPQDYVDYASNDALGIVRPDLLLSMSERLNDVTSDLEKRGLVILKDENGKYATRGWRNIKINGENIKPILAQGVREQKNVTVLNHVNITDLKTELDSGGKVRVTGAVGFSVNEPIFYDITSRSVLIATGGASGLYRPNNPGFSRHKMWYPPFNTGAGFAMGILAGAEMTTFEMRFIALRCKDTIAPTGTIAQGVGASQVNALGENYEKKYGLRTSERCWGTVEENKKGHGPCYLSTKGISEQTQDDLYKAYLNMAPSQTLKWLENGCGPSEQNVEVEETEPYIVGGHTASGYWVDDKRQTTVQGLFAAGDVAGGSPQKYVTGALAEAQIAAENIDKFLKKRDVGDEEKSSASDVAITRCASSIQAESKIAEYESFFEEKKSLFTTEQLEEAMQKIMDEYAGGISTNYEYNESKLALAEEKIIELEKLFPSLTAIDMDDLLRIYELRERLIVCKTLIAHLKARKETRWHSFAENTDFPSISKEYECYINSVLENGKIRIIKRPLVKQGEIYEHPN